MVTVKEYSGHTQITTLANHYLSATSASMERALEIQENLRPSDEYMQRKDLDDRFNQWAKNLPPLTEEEEQRISDWMSNVQR